MPLINLVAIPERRRHPRIHGEFPALIRYVDRGNSKARVAALLNLSASGCFLAIDSPPGERTKVLILTRVAFACHPAVTGPRLALRGIVVRLSGEHERPGVGLRLTSHRFLPPGERCGACGCGAASRA